MRFSSPLQHTLQNFEGLEDLYNQPGKTMQQELFLATQLTSQGFAEAGEYIHGLQTRSTNKGTQKFLLDLYSQWEEVQKIENLQTNLRNPELIDLLYRPDGTFFTAGREHPQKLLVVFTTIFNNFYLSNLVFVSFLRQLGVSVLILRDPTLFNYLNGVEEFGSNLAEVSMALGALESKRNIRELYVTGFSSSGYASLLFSELHRCDGYLGFSIRSDLSAGSDLPSGKFFTADVRARIAPDWLLDLGSVMASHPSTVRRKVVYGSLSGIDREHALHLRDVDNVRVHEIDGCGHVTVAAMLASGRLKSEFQSLLFDA